MCACACVCVCVCKRDGMKRDVDISICYLVRVERRDDSNRENLEREQ